MSKFDLDILLDNVDYTFPNYSPSEEALEFFTIIRLVQGEDFEFRTPLAHYFIVDTIFGNVTADNFPYSDEAKKLIPINILRIAVMASRGLAKSLPLDTKVLTPTGFTEMKDLMEGDEVINRYGKPTRIIRKSNIFYKDTYKIYLRNGDSFTVSEDHLNFVKDRIQGKEFVFTIKEILNESLYLPYSDIFRFSIPKYVDNGYNRYIDIIRIEQVPTVPTQCITVECLTESFVIENNIITHNSSIVTTFLPVYCAVKGELPKYGNVKFMLGVAASAQGGGRVISKSIESLCQDSVFCNDYFEKMRFTETESEFTRKGRGSLDSRTFLFRTLGFSGGIRGTRSNVGSHRPDAILFDDTILNSQAAYSTTQMETLSEIIHSDAENALVGGGKGRIIHVFTPFHMNDPNVKMLTGGSYTPIVLPICEKIYDNITEKEFKSAWNDMHPYHAVYSQYIQAKNNNQLRSFMQERMLRITSDQERMITDDMIKWYDRHAVINNLANFTCIVTTDFTASNSRQGDFSGMAVWAIAQNDHKYLIDLYLRKTSIQEQYDSLFRIVSRWSKNTQSFEVAVEIDGQQQLGILALEKMMIEKNVWFRFARQKGQSTGSVGIRSRGSGNKLERFRFMLPEFEMGKVHFPNELRNTPDMKELLHEIKLLSHGGIGSIHDDGLDLISQLGFVDYFIPTDTIDPETESFYNDIDHSIWGDGIVEEENERPSEVF